MTVVKICGITNVRDAEAAVDLGAEMLGLNFYDRSPRFLTERAAKEIVAIVPKNVDTVGVFVNESLDRIVDVADRISLRCVQIHGDENPEFVARLRERSAVKIIKAIRVSSRFDRKEVEDFTADGLLLDAYSPGTYGGTGERFDWKLAGSLTGIFDHLYLAGGLTPENVAEAIEVVRPYAVDVASGVEARPGKKDHRKLKAFIDNAKNI